MHGGELALSVALETWGKRIVDPPRRTWADAVYDESRLAIDAMIRGPMGLSWSRCSPFRKEYRRDGDFEWCGAFAAWCWRHAGLDPQLAEIYFSSTYRLDRYASRKLAFGTPREVMLRRRLPGDGRVRHVFGPDSTVEDVEEMKPQPGDILLVDTVGGWSYGHHVTIVERWDPELGAFRTVEANATGRLPDGTIAQGVVRQLRRLEVCRRLIRPPSGDLVNGAPA
jgi:hypothetical protein